jgi:hypothetical protein
MGPRAGRKGASRLRSLGRRSSCPSVRYGGRLFAAASSLPLAGGLGRPGRVVRILSQAVRKPRHLLALLQLLVLTPREDVALSGNDTGRLLRAHFNRRFLGVVPQNRLCRGVLILPEDPAAYLRGRRRQAVRTNLRRAERLGIKCEVVADGAEAERAALAVLADRRGTLNASPDGLSATWREACRRPEVTILAARDASHTPVAVLATVIDESVCLIQLALATSHEARWSLHYQLVRVLISRGVRFLLADGDGPFGALGFEPHVQHFQHLLGYELRHLSP